MFPQKGAAWLSGDGGVKMPFRKGALASGVRHTRSHRDQEPGEHEVEQEQGREEVPDVGAL